MKKSDADEGIVVQSTLSNLSSEKCPTVKSSSSKRSSGVFNLPPPSFYRIITLTHKNLVQIFRNIGLVCVIILYDKLLFKLQNITLRASFS
jgi:hypothetical protein